MGTNDAHKQWAAREREWLMEMVLHRTHDAGGFRVAHDTISRRAAFHFQVLAFHPQDRYRSGAVWYRHRCAHLGTAFHT